MSAYEFTCGRKCQAICTVQELSTKAFQDISLGESNLTKLSNLLVGQLNLRFIHITIVQNILYKMKYAEKWYYEFNIDYAKKT